MVVPRLLIISSRLPVTVVADGADLRMDASSGGVATGLRGLHDDSDSLWIGWPGVDGDHPSVDRAAITARLATQRILPVWLDADEVTRFYEGFANAVLWPLFHYQLEQLPLQVQHWDTYVRINQRFADLAAAHYQPGDIVWVHDYQLMLVPQLLRAQVPDARIGFFLHIPFPASEVFRALPNGAQVLEGMLGADLVGFHTAAYLRHFGSALLRIAGRGVDVDRVRVGRREVRLGVFPMGIDVERYSQLAETPDVLAEASRLRADPTTALVIGIDRLDYTKGIARRTLAFETLLRRHPSLRERVRLIQVAVPSRTQVDAYQNCSAQMDALIGRVNGTFGTSHWTPVHYLHRSLSAEDVTALYRAADVMLVTPLRDGMNLVAKEFVAARTDEDGVLVLSDFAGAAAELAEALHVNPYDVDGTADAVFRALTMTAAERRMRMRALRHRVVAHDARRWATRFIDALREASDPPARPIAATTELHTLVSRLRNAPHLLLILDYDGTLVPFANVPELASPAPDTLALLAALSARPNTTVHIASGRSRESLERWLGHLPVGLHAEHGAWSRAVGADDWVPRAVSPAPWRARVLDILQETALRTPGSLVEEKTVSLSWHYRMADPEWGTMQARELRLHLTEILANTPVEVVQGADVIEVRAYGAHKGALVGPLLRAAPTDTTILAIGDDATDEDLFAALPTGAIAIHVGQRPSRAAIRVSGVEDVHRLLWEIADDEKAPAASPTAASPRPDVACAPFRFWTRTTLTRLTGRRARDLAELVAHLRAVPMSVIFHHTHHFLVQHQHLSPEPPNDFAFWVTNTLQEEALGEQLAAIDTVSFEHLHDLRDRVVDTIATFLEMQGEQRAAPSGEEFHFMDAVSFVLPTPHEARTLAEFTQRLRAVGAGTIAYHLFESRLRHGRDDNDLSRWLEDDLGLDDMAQAIRTLDPYTHTMEGIRQRLLQVVTATDGAG